MLRGPGGCERRGSPGGGTGSRGPGSWSLRPPGVASRNSERVPRASPGNIGDSFEKPTQERREHKRCGRGGPERRSRSRGERPDSFGRKRALKRPGQFPTPGPSGKNVHPFVPENPTGKGGLGGLDPHLRLPLLERRLRAEVSLPWESLGEETQCKQSQRIFVNRLFGVLKHPPLHSKYCRDEFRRRFSGQSEKVSLS